MKPGNHLPILALVSIMAFAFPDVGLTADYKEVAVTNGGSIKGKVAFKGALPRQGLAETMILKDREVCGRGFRKVFFVDVKDGALRETFVFIDKIKEGKKWLEPEGGGYLIDQKGCYFRPWAQVLKYGSPITIRNSDPGVLHNVNARELIGVETGQIAVRTLFNFGQPDPGDIEQRVKPRRSPFILVNCENHNFMFAFLMASKHPYAVVVREDGSFSLDDVPPGNYLLKAWHPRLGMKRTRLTVPAGGEVEANFVFSEIDEILTGLF